MKKARRLAVGRADKKICIPHPRWRGQIVTFLFTQRKGKHESSPYMLANMTP